MLCSSGSKTLTFVSSMQGKTLTFVSSLQGKPWSQDGRSDQVFHSFEALAGVLHRLGWHAKRATMIMNSSVTVGFEVHSAPAVGRLASLRERSAKR